jgi:chaperonin GroES
MKLQPLFNNVIVKPLQAEEMTKSGIVLPSVADKENPEKGEIIACGPGKVNNKGELVKMSVQVGDKVIFKKYSPDEVEIDNEKYLVLSESDILAILR